MSYVYVCATHKHNSFVTFIIEIHTKLCRTLPVKYEMVSIEWKLNNLRCKVEH